VKLPQTNGLKELFGRRPLATIVVLLVLAVVSILSGLATTRPEPGQVGSAASPGPTPSATPSSAWQLPGNISWPTPSPTPDLNNAVALSIKRAWPQHYRCGSYPPDANLHTTDLIPGAQVVARLEYRWRYDTYEIKSDPRIKPMAIDSTITPDGVTHTLPHPRITVMWQYDKPVQHFAVYVLRRGEGPYDPLEWTPEPSNQNGQARTLTLERPISGMYPAILIIGTDPDCQGNTTHLPNTFSWIELARREQIAPQQ